MVESQILDSVYGMVGQLIHFIPILIAVIVLVVVGWILGKILGKVGSTILDKMGLDDLIDKTAIGGMIEKAEMSTVGLFAAVIRWFVYFIFAIIIIDVLEIQIVADFLTQIILYIPLVVSAAVVLLIGLLIVGFLAGLIKKILMATGVDDKVMASDVGESLKANGVTASGIIAGLIKLFGYLIFITAASEILQLTLITNFLMDVINYIPHLFTGILILIIGLVAIDFMMDYLQVTMKGMKVEGADVMVPVLKGFLFLVVTLMALDTMLINTGIFYIFLGPLAWGFAIVVAFKWGIKEAAVAYAQSKK
ncbi:MAG: hypothetical protein M8349_07640 [ANME-2 cluster archaeon]|nr:hypothetical protein [ANME-2 cluster archaeon]